MFPSVYADIKEGDKAFVFVSLQIATLVCQFGEHQAVAEETSFHHDDSGHISTLTIQHCRIRAEDTQTFKVGHGNLVLKLVGATMRIFIKSLSCCVNICMYVCI